MSMLSTLRAHTRGAMLALAALPLCATAAAAQDEPPLPPTGPQLGFVFEAAGDFGGDPVATVLFEDGSTQELPAGQGLTLAAGGQVRPSAASPFALRGTLGFKFEMSAADNANISFTRVPIELVATMDLPSGLWVGAGVVRHTAVHFNGDDFGPDMSFEDGNGATAEFGWRWIALTYTAMQYTDEEGADYDASSVGVSFIYRP